MTALPQRARRNAAEIAEDVLWFEVLLYLSLTLTRNSNEEETGTTYAAAATPDHNGANDSLSFRRNGLNSGSDPPKSVIFVNA